MGTAIKHPVSNGVKLSFVIFVTNTLISCHPCGSSGCKRVKITLRMMWWHFIGQCDWLFAGVLWRLHCCQSSFDVSKSHRLLWSEFVATSALISHCSLQLYAEIAEEHKCLRVDIRMLLCYHILWLFWCHDKCKRFTCILCLWVIHKHVLFIDRHFVHVCLLIHCNVIALCQ